jgi:hypothetical protein
VQVFHLLDEGHDDATILDGPLNVDPLPDRVARLECLDPFRPVDRQQQPKLLPEKKNSELKNFRRSFFFYYVALT